MSVIQKLNFPTKTDGISYFSGDECNKLAGALDHLIEHHNEETTAGTAPAAVTNPVHREGVVPPPDGMGVSGDTYHDTAAGKFYQKVGSAYVVRAVTKGADGKSAYQSWLDEGNTGTVAQFLQSLAAENGADGQQGSSIFDKTYAPTAGDNDSVDGRPVQENDQWYHSINESAYARYAFKNGSWRLVFKTPTVTTATTPTATNAAPQIQFNAPASGAIVTVGTQLQLTATATDDVSVSQVEFLNGSTGAALGMGNKNGSTYTLPFTPSTAGAYTFTAKATDGAGLTAQASVSITVQAAPVAGNVLPTANAGSDVTIQLPTNQLMLQGSGTDSDGTVSSYAWSQITGPNNASGLPSSSATQVVSNLIAGIYQFRLTVTDNQGGQKSDDVLVTVNAAPAQASGPSSPATDVPGRTDSATTAAGSDSLSDYEYQQA